MLFLVLNFIKYYILNRSFKLLKALLMFIKIKLTLTLSKNRALVKNLSNKLFTSYLQDRKSFSELLET